MTAWKTSLMTRSSSSSWRNKARSLRIQKKEHVPPRLTDGADKQTAKMLNLCGNCGFYGHQPDKCRLPEGATSRFNNITAENNKDAEKSQGNGSG